MKRIFKPACWTTLLALVSLTLAAIGASVTSADTPKNSGNEQPAAESKAAPLQLPSVDEARGRAILLHETIQGMLQVVHHEYYREDEKLPIPARTFKPVFRDLADRQHVEVRWLAVNGQPMNQDHTPKNDFEKQAVAAIASGAKAFELADNGLYRRAGAITLTAECLKCHVPNRTSIKNHFASLVITMPIEKR